MIDKVYFAVVLLALAVVATVIYVSMIFDGRVNACQEKGGVFIKASSGYVCISKDAVL